MNFKNISKPLLYMLALGMAFGSCQKMERPVLGELILDPPPPPYMDLKTLLAFENNLTDAGENKLTALSNAVTYVPGVTGQAVKFGAGGYVLFKGTDTTIYPNGFKGIAADTLKNLGSVTLAFWMNGPGPVKDGAQGLFSISNKSEFWGNLDLFLENNDNGSEGFLKVHMFNASATSGNGEEWTEAKIPNMLNKWTHVAITYDATSAVMNWYIDGVPKGIINKVIKDGKYGKLKFNNFNGMVVGTYQFQTNPTLTNHGPESWAKSFNGSMDQFRIYNRALTAAEVTDLFTTKK
ncbi:MAG: LamG domain-containing protein [Ferruginibacter sp.]|nr:LamG domain-containing protein [Ferruginibacter sp.]